MINKYPKQITTTTHSFSYSHMYKDAYVQFNWSFLGKRIPPPPPPPCRFCKNFVHMKHHAPVQTVRERYNSRREKILNNILRIFSRRLLHRSRSIWTVAWCFIYVSSLGMRCLTLPCPRMSWSPSWTTASTASSTSSSRPSPAPGGWKSAAT